MMGSTDVGIIMTSMGEDIDLTHATELDDDDQKDRYDASRWLRKKVGVVAARDLPAEPSEEDFRQGLRSGTALCIVLNKIKPGSVSKVVNAPSALFNTPDAAAQSAYLENVKNFLLATEEIGLPGFDPSDLEPEGDFSNVVHTILALKAYSETGSLDFSLKKRPSRCGKTFLRRNSEPAMNVMSITQSVDIDSLLADEPEDECDAGPLYTIVCDLLEDREEEDIPIIIENILKKIKEEFESRLGYPTKDDNAIESPISYSEVTKEYNSEEQQEHSMAEEDRAAKEQERINKEKESRALQEKARKQQEAEKAAKEEQERLKKEKLLAEQEKAKKEEEERLRKEKELLTQQEKARKEEEERLRKEEEEQLRKEEEERLRKEEEERLRKEEEERLRKEEEERIRKEKELLAQQEKAKKEEEERLRKEEEERLRKEKELLAQQERARKREEERIRRENEKLARKEKARKEKEERKMKEKELRAQKEQARKEEAERKKKEKELLAQQEKARKEEERIKREKELLALQERAEQDELSTMELERLNRERELLLEEERIRKEEEEQERMEIEREKERARKKEEFIKRMDEYSKLNVNTTKRHELSDQQGKELQGLKSTVSTAKTEVQSMQTSCQEEADNLGKHVNTICQAAAGYNKVLEENRKLYNQVQDLKGSIRVYCRIRPFLAGKENQVTSVDYTDDETVAIIVQKSGKEGRKASMFNKVFGPSATQEEVFSDTQPLIRSVLDGFNVCVFACGQTGAGKTYTLTGPEELTPETMGVNYRALNDLFLISDERKNLMNYQISINMVEIYNEEIRDLLVTDGTSKPLDIVSGTKKGINLPDVTLVPVSSTDEVKNLINLSRKNRAVNDRSSRAHSFLTAHVFGKDLTAGTTTKGCMHLVDLAGSEKLDNSDEEAEHVSKSLAALGDVLVALATKSSRVSYKTCKLTQLLQDVLANQAKILMFVHVHPHIDETMETLSTFKFVERFSTVEGGCGKSADVRELKEQICLLKSALARKEAGDPTWQDLLGSPRGGKDSGFGDSGNGAPEDDDEGGSKAKNPASKQPTKAPAKKAAAGAAAKPAAKQPAAPKKKGK